MHVHIKLEGRSLWARICQTYLVRNWPARTGRSHRPEVLVHLGAAKLWESEAAQAALAALISTGDYSHLITSGIPFRIQPKTQSKDPKVPIPGRIDLPN